MLVSFDHHVKDFSHELIGHFLVKEVGHRVYEYHLRLFPTQWHLESLRPKFQIKSLFVGMTGHTPKPLGKRLCIAVLAPRTDLSAAGDGVPCRIGPFDRALRRHAYDLRSRCLLKMSLTIFSATGL